jgi:hypothetical protein
MIGTDPTRLDPNRTVAHEAYHRIASLDVTSDERAVTSERLQTTGGLTQCSGKASNSRCCGVSSDGYDTYRCPTDRRELTVSRRLQVATDRYGIGSVVG